jgi:outer membrane receptor protein involved in Fe transport
VGSQFDTYLSLLLSDLVTGTPSPNFLKTGLTFPYVGGVNYNNGDGSVDQYRQTDNTYALFTNETLHITDKLEITGGVRYTDDSKSLNQLSSNVGNGAGCAAGNNAFAILAGVVPPATLAALAGVDNTLCLPFLSPGYNNFTNHQAESEKEVSGTAKVVYRFNPQILGYASYSRGYKAGGFNLDRVQCTIGAAGCAPGSAAAITPDRNTGFPGEFVDAYEIGEKATLLDRKLLLNVALFDQIYTGFQLNTFTGLVFVVESIPEVTSRGVDADFVWLPVKNLAFQGGLTVADTRFSKSSYASILANDPQFLGAPGARISFAPLYSASFSTTYTVDLSDAYKARFNVGVKYSSKYNTGSDLDPGKIQNAYALVNARLALGPRDERWAVEVWSENLFNQNYKQVAFDSGFQNAPTNATGVLDAFLGAPRTYGVTFRAKY